MAMGKAFYAGFPDGKHTIEEVVATGDHVVVFARWGGTHRGEFQGVPATGRRVSFTAIEAYKLEGGKIVEHRGEFDAVSMMQQLTV
jgi:predicted ester cyclase